MVSASSVMRERMRARPRATRPRPRRRLRGSRDGRVEAEEDAVLGVGTEDGADGVVGADGFETDLHAGDVAAIDLGAGADLGTLDSRFRGWRGTAVRWLLRVRRRAWRPTGGRGQRRR